MVLSGLTVFEVPIALAQTTTTWGRIKREADGPVIDPSVDPALLGVALRAARTLSPRVTPEFVVRVDLPTGFAVAVAGAADATTWAVHVVLPSEEPLGTTVFDDALGVIRDPEAQKVAWSGRAGDLKRQLEDRIQTLGIGGFVRNLLDAFCREATGYPYARLCVKLMEQYPNAGLACLGIVLALTAFCDYFEHITMPPDPGEGAENGDW
jgi:hypothetical protein